MRASLCIILVAVILVSCKKDPEIKSPGATADPYEPLVPEGWPQPVYDFANNDVTYERFMLGRHLFYEPMLSEDTTISCGSCHQQIFAFSNGPSHATSHGVHEQFGNRNSPAIFNITWHTAIMWDGRVSNIENQPLGPIQNPIEMNLNINSALGRIASMAKYKTLFKNAYGDTVVNSQRFLKAFAQFMGLMVSYRSKYDQVKSGKDAFTGAENNGYAVYKSKCASCHAEPLFSDYTFRNNGLPINGYQDSGRYNFTFAAVDMFRFKVPSLRNLGFSAPYMHDGRFTSLSQVLNHYTGGIANTPNLDPLLSGGISLSTQERNDLLSFLATLNDYAFINDERFKEIH